MKTALCDVMEEAYNRGWITTRDGNVSLVRRGEDRLVITPSGVRKNKIRVEDLVTFRIDRKTETLVSKDPDANPSGELEMHFLLQKDYKGFRCVLHLHPTNVVAAMYGGWNLKQMVVDFPELYRYTTVAPDVRALPAISSALAKETYQAFAMNSAGVSKYDIVGQKNHGVTAIAENPWDAFEHVERLEHIAQIVLASGVKPTP